MAHALELRPRQRTAPLEYAFLLVLVAALATLAVVAITMVSTGRLSQTGSCLTSSVCAVDGASSATPGRAVAQPRQ